MNRNEAMLRELNLYPQWVRRNQPELAEQRTSGESLAVRPAPSASLGTDGVDEAHETALPADPGQPATGLDRAETINVPADSPAVTPPSGIGAPDWLQLKALVGECNACGLRAGCTQTVFGTGDENADWLFVGEGPGADEDVQGEPFVGQAGKLLDNMLLAIKLRRGRNVYIANIVKCRPPRNRNPNPDEIAACLPYLQRQIELIKPRLIVALGKTAATALLGREATLGSLRGALHDYRGIPLIVTYHPAYLLRSPMEKAKAWQDLCAAVQTLQGKV